MIELTSGSTGRHEGTGAAIELSPDDALGLLANQRRRYILHYLSDRERRTTVGALATQIAAWENDVSPEGVMPTQRKSVYNTLYQTHLPKLADHGVVEYDSERKTVARASNAEEIARYATADDGGDWWRYYLASAFVGAAVVAADVVGVVAGPGMDIAVSSVVVGLFALVTVSYAVDS